MTHSAFPKFPEQYGQLFGRTVMLVDGATLYLDDGKAFEFQLDGDCCSKSEYTDEGIAAFCELQGATILKIEDRESAERAAEMVKKWGVEESDSWHFLVFTTNKGHVTIDWRNVSNGYYDGSVNVVERPGLPLPAHDAAHEKRYDVAKSILAATRKAADR